MHILFITDNFPPEVNAPASRTFGHINHWLKDKDIKVTVITCFPNFPNGKVLLLKGDKWIPPTEIDVIVNVLNSEF